MGLKASQAGSWGPEAGPRRVIRRAVSHNPSHFGGPRLAPRCCARSRRISSTDCSSPPRPTMGTRRASRLLALLDDQRFARGVPPDRLQLQAVMVRRLNNEPEIRAWDGRPRFPLRRIVPLEVDYPDEERKLHIDLQRYTTLLVERSRREGRRFAAEFVTKLLKKRLFSSPQAFALTLAEHAGPNVHVGGTGGEGISSAAIPLDRGAKHADWLLREGRAGVSGSRSLPSTCGRSSSSPT